MICYFAIIFYSVKKSQITIFEEDQIETIQNNEDNIRKYRKKIKKDK